MFLKDRGHHDERTVQAMKSSPCSPQLETAPQSIKDPEQPKVIKKKKKNTQKTIVPQQSWNVSFMKHLWTLGCKSLSLTLRDPARYGAGAQESAF